MQPVRTNYVAPTSAGVKAAVAGAQQKGICPRKSAPEAAAGFLLSALNGLLIEYLFLGAKAVDPEGAVAMVAEWLFGDSPESSSSSSAGGA